MLTLVTVDKISAVSPARKNWRVIDKVIVSPDLDRCEWSAVTAKRIAGRREHSI
jgi:hypothetical protein